MSIEAESFMIRCSINQVTHLSNINQIFIIMDFIHTARKIFDSLLHLYQIYSISISHKLREFFKEDSNNLVEF